MFWLFILSLCKSTCSLFANNSLQNTFERCQEYRQGKPWRICNSTSQVTNPFVYLCGNSATSRLLGLWRNCVKQGNADSGIPESSAGRIRNPESKFQWQKIRKPVALESTTWDSEYNPRLSWITLHGGQRNVRVFYWLTEWESFLYYLCLTFLA